MNLNNKFTINLCKKKKKLDMAVYYKCQHLKNRKRIINWNEVIKKLEWVAKRFSDTISCMQ